MLALGEDEDARFGGAVADGRIEFGEHRRLGLSLVLGLQHDPQVVVASGGPVETHENVPILIAFLAADAPGELHVILAANPCRSLSDQRLIGQTLFGAPVTLGAYGPGTGDLLCSDVERSPYLCLKAVDDRLTRAAKQHVATDVEHCAHDGFEIVVLLGRLARRLKCRTTDSQLPHEEVVLSQLHLAREVIVWPIVSRPV